MCKLHLPFGDDGRCFARPSPTRMLKVDDAPARNGKSKSGLGYQATAWTHRFDDAHTRECANGRAATRMHKPKYETDLKRTEPEIISFKLNKEDLAKIGEVVAKVQVTTGVDVANPGAFTIRNHSFSPTEPGA